MGTPVAAGGGSEERTLGAVAVVNVQECGAASALPASSSTCSTVAVYSAPCAKEVVAVTVASSQRAMLATTGCSTPRRTVTWPAVESQRTGSLKVMMIAEVVGTAPAPWAG